MRSLVLATLVHRVASYASFLHLIPNGVHGQGEWHGRAFGHISPLPDESTPQVAFRRNDFGRAFLKAGRKWTRELCMADSDGDGMSNGEELGDPDCVWRVGQTPTHKQRGHPGIPDGPKSSPGQAELDLPSAFNISGGGFAAANGMYVLVDGADGRHAAHAWAKRQASPYLWKNVDADCVLHQEKHYPWGISCYGDHVYLDGGNASVPSQLQRVVDNPNNFWERGVPPVPNLEPVRGAHLAPEADVLPTYPTDAISVSAHYMLAFVYPALLLLGAVLSWRFAWLPHVRYGLFACILVWLSVGVEIGSHRYFSHKAFTTGSCGKTLLSLAAGMALQDTPINWASIHRTHHRACDHELDFHSPLYSGGGFWFSHAEWLSTPRRHVPKLSHSRVEDLLDDDEMWLAHHADPVNGFVAWVAGSVAVAVCATLRYKAYRQSKFQLPILALYYFCMYGMLPVFLVWHQTMLVNSAVHIWGDRPFVDGMMPHLDACESRNLALFLPLQWGQNWHNNHHASPGSASNWVYWYQVDFFFLFIRAMESLGIVWNVRVESPAVVRPGHEGGSMELPTVITLVCGLVAIILWRVMR